MEVVSDNRLGIFSIEADSKFSYMQFVDIEIILYNVQ